MTDLMAWLREQLDADERDAQEAITWEDGSYTGHAYTWMLTAYLRGKVKRQHVIPGAPSPRYVLDKVAADRRIVDYCATMLRNDRITSSNSNLLFDLTREGLKSMAVQAEVVLRLLALPYADRPGYREEWRP